MAAMSEFALRIRQSTGHLSDIDVDGVVGSADHEYGMGLLVFGTVDAQRVRLRNTTEWALLVANDVSTLDMHDLIVDHVTPATLCMGQPCNDGGGDDVVCALGAGVSIDGFSLTGAGRAGLAVAAGCSL